MKLLSVQLARSLWFLDLGEVNPRGKNIFEDLVPALIKTFGFKTFPKAGDDFKDGMRFTLGAFTNSAGDAIQVGLAIYSDGVAADTYSSTADSDEFLGQAIKILLGEGYSFDPGMIRKKSYLSQVFVRCAKQLTSLNPKLEQFAQRIAEATGEGSAFGCSVLEFWPDQTRAIKPTNFSFQKRTGDAFDDHRYWSQAGMTTKKHLDLLEELEAILS